MAISRSKARKVTKAKDDKWYRDARHEYQDITEYLFNLSGWYYCDPDSYYDLVFPAGSLQEKGHVVEPPDGKPNAIVVEDTGIDVPVHDADGNPILLDDGKPRVRRIMHRYTVTDDHDELETLRNIAIEKNTFMFLSPISYYGKSRGANTARYLHAIQIDLDYVGLKQLKNLLKQMEGGVIPYANAIICSGTGVHVVYLLDRPFPLMTRYVDGLQAIKRALTDLIWNSYTSKQTDPEKRQYQGIYQGFRMVGSPTKLNGEIGNPKLKQPYVCEAFTHDATPRATIDYLLSFMPRKICDAAKSDLSAYDGILNLSKAIRPTTKLEDAKELWPDWYDKYIVNEGNRDGWLFGKIAYYDCLNALTEQASVGHRYWCVVYLAAMANKCGIDRETLEADAYGLVKRLDALTDDPDNPFTEHDVACALDIYENGKASAVARRYKKEYMERKSGIHWEPRGHRRRPAGDALPQSVHLAGARAIRDAKQAKNGTNWWDGGNRDGAPKKAMQVWRAAVENPGSNHSELARIAGVSRPTVLKWLSVENWHELYDVELGKQNQQPSDEYPRLTKEQMDFYDEFGQQLFVSIALNPWKTADEIAVTFGIEPEDVLAIVRENARRLHDYSEGEPIGIELLQTP